MRVFAFTVVIATIGLMGVPATTRADGGASVAFVAYLKQECVSFGSQAVNGWRISYGPAIEKNGDFLVTFRNEIRYGPGKLGKETWWIDVRGNLKTGTIHSVKGRGNPVIKGLTACVDGIRKHFASKILAWRDRYLKDVANNGGGGGGGKVSRAYLPTGGWFQRQPNGTWLEYDSNGRVTFTFREANSDGRFYYLRDDRRKITLAIPKANGRSRWKYDGQAEQLWSAITWK